jgi:hypothetical protein
VVIAVLAVIAITLGVVGLSSTGGALDPRSAAPYGTLALATLLRERGVAVAVSESTHALAGETTVVAYPSLMSSGALARLAGEAGRGTVVLVAPSAADVAAVDARVRVAGTVGNAARAPGCALPAARAAGVADTGGVTFAGSPAVSCYPARPGGPGSLVVAQVGAAHVVLLGEAEPLLNTSLASQGNAALAVGLLSTHPRVRWLLPGPPAPGTRHASLVSLLPRRLVDTFWEVCLALVLLALARGRRLGPPVEEPLPVAVRATETVLGRARLYQAARARDAAAAALRSATRRRLSAQLGLGGAAVVTTALVPMVADRAGRTTENVTALLYGAGPAGPQLDDDGLLRLAHDLTVLEEQVRPR